MAINMNGGVEMLLQFKGMGKNDPQVADAYCRLGQTLTQKVRNHCTMVSLLKQLGSSVPLLKKGGKVEFHVFTLVGH
jgi:hypothetical protein